MGKYRGADGWLYDESTERPRRYEGRDRTEAPGEGLVDEAKKDPDVGACCFLTSIFTVCPLLGMGMGYGGGGFGGLLAGLAIGLALPMGLSAWAIHRSGQKKERNGPQ